MHVGFFFSPLTAIQFYIWVALNFLNEIFLLRSNDEEEEKEEEWGQQEWK